MRVVNVDTLEEARDAAPECDFIVPVVGGYQVFQYEPDCWQWLKATECLDDLEEILNDADVATCRIPNFGGEDPAPNDPNVISWDEECALVRTDSGVHQVPRNQLKTK